MDPASFETLHDLPVYDRQADIVRSVDENQVTIIVAETGAGKSTQVPQFLAEHGYQKVIVTQPRILAARNLCGRVRQEYSWRMGRDATSEVGYRTAHERDDNPDTKILYCTDGLQLVRELTGSGINERQVLVLDEIHEWNENMEVLVAWAKKRCAEDPHFRVVCMSATIEADSLAAYFNAPAPITIPGRTFDVEKRYSKDLILEIITQARNRSCNMLVFLPGKAEIEAVAEAIESEIPKGVPIIPLHSQLDAETQQQAFARYDRGKIILATNVAQTSITIDDIDMVIDSGLERRAEVRSGVEGLFIEQTSQADCLQRAGRAGRTREGLYVLAQFDTLPCAPLDERPEYGVPEIMRKHIDRLVLRLANIGIDIETLEFYHSPSRKAMRFAKRTLVSLGAMQPDGTVTNTGRSMERFPVESSYARMLVEAEQYAPAVQAKLATIMAIQEVGGITKGGPRFTGWRKFTQQTRSDLLAEYDVYLALGQVNPDDFEDLGIIGKNVDKTQEVNERLNHDLGLGDVLLLPIADDEVDELLHCIVAGQLHQIWATEPDGKAMHIATKDVRELSSSTVVKHARLVAGTPFDLQVPTPKGLETLHLVNDLTAVDPAWLEQLAPKLFKVQPGTVYFDSYYGTLATRTLVKFNGKTFESAGTPLLERTPQNQRLFLQLYSVWLREKLEYERHAMQMASSQSIPHIPIRQVEERVRSIAYGAISLQELNKQQRLELNNLSKLATYFDEAFLAKLESHTRHHYHEHRRHGRKPWRPDNKQKYNRRRGR